MKDFESWLNQEPEVEEKYFLLHCYGCGKDQCVTRSAFENGDTGWYSLDPKMGSGVCGGSQFCLP